VKNRAGTRAGGERNSSGARARISPESDRFAGGNEQARELAEPLLAEVAELAAVELTDGPLETGEKGEPLRRNVNQNPAAVGVLAAAADEPAFLEAVEQASNVGVAADHAFGNFTTEQAFGCAAQNAKDVVLVRREIVLPEKLSGSAGEQVGGADEVDEGNFFRAGMRVGRGRPGHDFRMVVTTNECQKKRERKRTKSQANYNRGGEWKPVSGRPSTGGLSGWHLGG